MRWMCPSATQTSLPLWLGYGYPLGILAATVTMRLVDLAGAEQNFAAPLCALTTLALAGTWLSARAATPPENGGETATPKAPSWQRWAVVLLAALLLLRLSGLALEVLWRPLYPWDALSTWGVKARVWFEARHLVPFVDGATWLASYTPQRYTIEAWDYPSTVPLIQLWMALALDRWDDALINVPWLVCAVALGLAFYGQSLNADVTPLMSILGAYLLLSMPLLDAHVALAGYADLWLATCVGLAAMAFFQSGNSTHRGQGWLALLLLMACPFVKREGVIWALAFLPALLLTRLSYRTLLATAGLVAAAAVTVVLHGVNVPLRGLGQLVLSRDKIEVPYLGTQEIGYHPTWGAFYQHLFVFDSWHIFWPLFFAVLLASLFTRDRRLSDFRILLITMLLAILGIFSFSGNAAFAERGTGISRILLQIVPVCAFYVVQFFSHRLGTRTVEHGIP